MAIEVGMKNLVDKDWFKKKKHMTRRLEQNNKTRFIFKINNCTSNTDCIQEIADKSEFTLKYLSKMYEIKLSKMYFNF